MSTETPATGLALDFEIEQRRPMPLTGAFACRAGELLAVVGPSGAGKTSMMRVLAGLMRPENGRIAVGREVWCDTARGIYVPAQHRHVGLVFQNYALMPHLSAVDNVALSLLHLPGRTRREQARQWLEHMHLTPEQQSRRPVALSGGQQQRVAVARALAREPRLLLLDEPFSAVDQMSRRSLYALLADLRRELAIPIVLVTHDLAEARLLADQLVVLDGGTVLQQGAPHTIHFAPRNARVAELVGVQNHFTGQWLGPAHTKGWGLLRWTASDGASGDAPVLTVRDKGRIPAGQLVTWVIPNDGIALVDGSPTQVGGFLATVQEARHLGEISLASLALSKMPDTVVRVTLSGPTRSQLTVGQPCCVRLDLGLIHVMPLRNRS
ncbi:ATP-binding cassette domain-containing protein [Ralstonia pickettii]|jgi:molybdate transport system ATP-binding protein|uniref:ATP-binding cassette domain-containing protein n=1 Tax=Ralstonia pickettii TaxID=329 RepID=A0A7X2L9G0_RALPI|nr:ABC transporter ATP-binding protein [Ralstonia pickettii]MRS98044.1 ATP-binding cassette domain-containing protein [Ralstonia pickettii]